MTTDAAFLAKYIGGSTIYSRNAEAPGTMVVDNAGFVISAPTTALPVTTEDWVATVNPCQHYGSLLNILEGETRTYMVTDPTEVISTEI